MHWMLYGLLLLFMWVVQVLLWLYFDSACSGSETRCAYSGRSLPSCEAQTDAESGFQFMFMWAPWGSVCGEGVYGGRCIVLAWWPGYVWFARVYIFFQAHPDVENSPHYHTCGTCFQIDAMLAIGAYACTSWQHTQNHRYIGVFVVIIFMCCNPQCQIDDPGSRPDDG